MRNPCIFLSILLYPPKTALKKNTVLKTTKCRTTVTDKENKYLYFKNILLNAFFFKEKL